MSLLNKTRSLNRLLQRAAGNSVSFMEMSEVLRDLIAANIFVISRKGKILGFATLPDFPDGAQRALLTEERRLPEQHNEVLKKIGETCSNTDRESPYYLFVMQIDSFFAQNHLTIIPIIGGGDRLGTVVLTRDGKPFVDDDLIMAEYGSTIIGMEILRERAEEIEIEARSKTAAQVAVNSLSYSEMEAVDHIIEELNGREGLLVASKIADRVGITRSVIVNALRKLESAGVIETRSLGVKGTYIRVLNEQLIHSIASEKHK